MSARILLLDNRDSFTYNLMDELQALGCIVEVFRNHHPAAALLARALGATLVLSPGPGTPASAGCLLELCALAHGRVPVLGICLGHQALVEVLGGTIGLACEPRHGQASAVHHSGHAVFDGVPSPFRAGRYHSLAALTLPHSLTTIARADDGTVMAVADRAATTLGLQFHPESILTPEGRRVLGNALAWLARAPGAAVAA